MEMVCIVCPNGCRLTVTRQDGQIAVSGNKCKRGESFAVGELTHPTRSVTGSVRSTVKEYPVVSVKTDGEIPKDKIFDLMSLCRDLTITQPLPIGTVLIDDLFGTGVRLVTTRDMEESNE